MAEKQRDMSGVLFPNDRKENENQPDFKGRITVDGVERWLSCWNKTSKRNSPYMSLAVTDMDPPEVEDVPTDAPAGDDPDKLPF